MCVAIVLVVAARVRLLGVPLERDEGEYAYMGQLMLQGAAPYGAAANMKLPGTSAAYAVLMALFGQSFSGIHFGLLLVNLASVVLVFFLAKKLFGPFAGVSAAASYAVLSVGAGVMGIWAHATNFVVLPALGATLAAPWGRRPGSARSLLERPALRRAFLMKQPGILFAIFGGLYLIYSQRNLLRSKPSLAARNVAIFGAAVCCPLALRVCCCGGRGCSADSGFGYSTTAANMRPCDPSPPESAPS